MLRVSTKYNLSDGTQQGPYNEQFVKQFPAYLPPQKKHSPLYTITQNVESFLLSIKQRTRIVEPLLLRAAWHVRPNLYGLPVLEILPNSSLTRSGQSNGVEIILDLETFDNADQGVDYDALQVIIGNKEDFPVFELAGFSIRCSLKSITTLHILSE